MTARVLPSPDLYAVCPNGGPVLQFYEGIFEAAYVLLQPFLRLRANSVDPFHGETDPTKAQICTAYEAVNWSEIQRLSGLQSRKAVDIALRTRIGGLRADFAKPELAEMLKAALESEGMHQPTEGIFSELTHDKVLAFVQSQGHEWVWVGDEFGTERKLHWIEDLKAPDSTVTLGTHCNVFTPDKKLLWTTHWDSHFSFLCGSRTAIDALAQETGLEGFACDRSTEVYWSVR